MNRLWSRLCLVFACVILQVTGGFCAQVEGIVQRQIEDADGNIALRLATAGEVLSVTFPAEWNLRCRDYLDKRLRLEGDASNSVFHVMCPADFTVIGVARRPESFPPITLVEIRHDGLAHLSPFRRVLEGVVKYSDDDGHRLVIADMNGEPIDVLVEFHNDCAAGDRCRLIGWLEGNLSDRVLFHVVDTADLTVLARAQPPPMSRMAIYGLLIIAACLVVIAGILYWVRVLRRVIARQAERLVVSMRDKIRLQAEADERARLAADLHDGFQQLLAGAMFKLEAGLRNLDRTEQARNELRAARTSLSNAQNGLRGYVWMIASEADSPKTVSDLFSHAIARLPHWQETVKLRVEGVERPLPRKRLGTLLMILLEGVGNALFHGHATFVSVKVVFAADDLVMTIADNGCGFDVTRLSSLSADGTHMGLRNMRRRAEDAGCAFNLESAPDEGVTITVRMSTKGVGV